MQNALQLPVLFFFLFFLWLCQSCPEYLSQSYPGFQALSLRENHVCCYLLISSENGFGHFKEELKCQARVALRKKQFVILCSAVRNLNKLQFYRY